MTVDNMSREPALVALFGLAIRLKTENRICHILPPYPLWNHFIGKEYGVPWLHFLREKNMDSLGG